MLSAIPTSPIDPKGSKMLAKLESVVFSVVMVAAVVVLVLDVTVWRAL
jgi:hypothetical protein